MQTHSPVVRGSLPQGGRQGREQRRPAVGMAVQRLHEADQVEAASVVVRYLGSDIGGKQQEHRPALVVVGQHGHLDQRVHDGREPGQAGQPGESAGRVRVHGRRR